MNTQHILIVDDDPEICTLLKDFLGKHHYSVSIAHNGKEMRAILKQENFDLIVLDIMMPGEDGLTLCRQLREESSVPIIMLSAMGEETDRIVGLEIGADDYLPKPFSPRELLARIKALLRRINSSSTSIHQLKQSVDSIPNIYFSKWTLDRNKRCLLDEDGFNVPLSSGEYELLIAFLEHAQHTLTRDQLMDIIHGKESTPFDRSIDVQVGRLRKKLEEDPKNPKIIITVRNGGYQFTEKCRDSKDEK